MALSIGSVVGGYRIEQVLGSGGMGTVYLAANPVLPRHDALKVLNPELSQDESFRARFIREASRKFRCSTPIRIPFRLPDQPVSMSAPSQLRAY